MHANDAAGLMLRLTRRLSLFLIIASLASLTILSDNASAQMDVDAGAYNPSATAVAGNFASFSAELSALSLLASPDGKSPRRAFMQLLANLLNASQLLGRADAPALLIRLGGNSADSNCFEFREATPGCRGNLTLETLQAYSHFSNLAKSMFSARVMFVLGTNLGGLNNASFEAREITALINEHMLGSVVHGVEIGNEVDIYIATHPSSKMDWPWSFNTEFKKYVAAFRAAGLPKHRIQGGAFASVLRPDFDIYDLTTYLKSYEEDLFSLSIHNYPTSTCSLGRKVKPVVRTQDILSRTASATQAILYGPFIKAAHKRGLAFVLGEVNSASCGGQENVSDTFASTLWAMDYMAEMSKKGADMVNFHGNGQFYAPFNFEAKSENFQVRPLYYGMLAFAEAVPHGSQWIDTRVDYGRDFPTSKPNSYAHAAVHTATQRLTFIFILKEMGTEPEHSFNIHATFGSKVCGSSSRILNASLRRLEPKDSVCPLQAKNGLFYAGQTFDGSMDGRLTGKRVEEVIQIYTQRSQSQEYWFNFTAASASVNIVTIFGCVVPTNF